VAVKISLKMGWAAPGGSVQEIFRNQFVLFRFSLVFLCYAAWVVEGLGGRTDTGRSFSEYEMMGKGANLHELDCVLPKLSGFLPGYLPCYNRDYRIGIIV